MSDPISKLNELHEGWHVEIRDHSWRGWELIVILKRNESIIHHYTGLDLEALIDRAHAGEKGD